VSPRPLRAEELPVGEEIDLGTYRTTAEEIVDFAAQWDPQPFHTDAAAAAHGYFGGIVASGVHTLAIFQRLAVAGIYRHWDVVAGRALREVQLLHPVRPGDVLRGTVVVTGVEPNRPDRALVTKLGRLTVGESTVMTAVFDSYVRRAGPDGGSRG
jgi:acyl dehydratase